MANKKTKKDVYPQPLLDNNFQIFIENNIKYGERLKSLEIHNKLLWGTIIALITALVVRDPNLFTILIQQLLNLK